MADPAGLPPYADEWLKAEAQMGGRFVLKGNVDDIRAQFTGLFAGLAGMLPPPSDRVSAVDETVPGGPAVRVYTPVEAAKAGELPIGLYIHSGGFVVGSKEAEDHIVRDIAQRVPMVLVSTDYRLAPENPFPAGLEDCVSAYRWMLENATRFGARPGPAVIMGGSAGGNLSAAVALKLADEPDVKPRGIVVAAASTVHPDFIPEEYKSYWHPERVADAALLNREAMMACLDVVGAAPTEPLFSLLLNPELKKLPRTWLVASDKDPTHDEMLMFADKLQKEGVDSQLTVYEGYPHFFWMLPMLAKTQEMMDTWAQQLRRMLGTEEA
ncbi:hypothetical protein EJ06DRAFT_527408 [Trichodelitschia bisporula]|uniref:Alpha/beta hydrolase fold-3 domain-containing protein n=1 Tax=Trichodelitschia bisporula TaxID=703511 RepID=A0A6G1I6Y0_9PEZI|nr:hypothetical protein EJ06DRAFT_527408 [Trichodelitschia bisporula]